MTAGSELRGNILSWPVRRDTQTVRAYVVEPFAYAPETHYDIFLAAVNKLAQPEIAPINAYSRDAADYRDPEPFDLLTFPEAFLAAGDFVKFIRDLQLPSSVGCIHVGLRPDSTSETHLLTTEELWLLLNELLEITQLQVDDLDSFQAWLREQLPGKRFNLGCLFRFDASGLKRVCLHPKIVRAGVESSALAEEHMAEGSLLSIVVLKPSGRDGLSITIQPLLCSDALLRLQTDRRSIAPIPAVSQGLAGPDTPDHIDIVSLATCTPQPGGATGIRWHEAFREAFRQPSSDGNLIRHHFATFVLSNFSSIPGTSQAGLSGIFFPRRMPDTKCPEFLSFYGWGRCDSEDDNIWHRVDIDNPAPKGLSVTGYLSTLKPVEANQKPEARMIGFDIGRLPRHSVSWTSATGVQNFKLYSAARCEASGTLKFCEKQHG